jgi:hypothetical protein
MACEVCDPMVTALDGARGRALSVGDEDVGCAVFDCFALATNFCAISGPRLFRMKSVTINYGLRNSH